jgi:hypothetical protein
MGKKIMLVVFGMVVLVASWAQKPLPKADAIEKHYQYLERETNALRESMQKENEAYRKFIQEERAAHRDFLETSIKYGSGLLAFVGVLLTFFGWNTFRGINESKKELESAAASRLLAFEKEMSEYKVRFLEAQQNLKQAEADYNRFLSYYSEANPRKGSYLLVGSEAKLQAMKENELLRFVQAFDMPVMQTLETFLPEKFYPALYDLIVYRSNVDEKGEDVDLQKLVQQLKEFPETPLVVYTPENIGPLTYTMLNEYGLFHMAKSVVPLIDNVASAYRVSKMLPKPRKRGS